MKPLARHADMPQFNAPEGELVVAGKTLTQLAHAHGTPYYVYDRVVILQAVQKLRSALPPRLGIHYALKANPFAPLVNFMATQVDGLDVASTDELVSALASGMSAAHISMAGPGKSDAMLSAALTAGIRINVESSGELQRIAALRASGLPVPRLSLRINPDFEVKSAGMRMGGSASPFGIDADQAPAVLAQAQALGLEIDGLHFYPGSQILRADVIVAMQRHCFDLAMQLAKHAGITLRSLNLGGGFGIPYFAGETRLDLAPIAAGLEELCQEARQQCPQARLHIELGRYLVGEAGLYVTRVVDRKTSHGKTYLITDGGMNHHLAASGNLGQVLRKNYPIALANRMLDEALETVSVAGPLCTPLDLLADNVMLPHAQPGDLIALYQSGAYGYSASPHGFLSHPLPKEILL
jgi:diaminopimelate decarboxylase